MPKQISCQGARKPDFRVPGAAHALVITNRAISWRLAAVSALRTL